MLFDGYIKIRKRYIAAFGIFLFLAFYIVIKNFVAGYNHTDITPSHFTRVSDDNEKILVFVHGVTGEVNETWLNSKNGAFWPKIVVDDDRLHDHDIFTVSYYTPLTENSPNIYELADQLNRILYEKGIYTRRGEGKAKYREVIFLGHSMGNLVIRTSMILSPPEAHNEMIPLILSIAAPSSGSNAAELVDRISDNPTFTDMANLQQNSFLALMNRTWLASRFDTEIACAYEKEKIGGVMVVERSSAQEVCTRTVTDADGIDEDHINIVKPDGPEHQIHAWLWRQLFVERSRKGWELERWDKEIIVAGKDYPESNIHLAMIAIMLEQEFKKYPDINIKITRMYEEGNGMRLFSLLKDQKIDIYAEYSGSLLFAYLDVDPVSLSQSEEHDRNRLERHHGVDKLNAALIKSDTNMTFYPQFGFDSPFQIVMLKQHAVERNLYKNGVIKMSDFAHLSAEFELGAGTGYFYRHDGYPGLKRFYQDEGLGFKNTRYIKHADVYDELLASKSNSVPLAIVGYATDYELYEDDRFVVIQDDKGFFPIHRPGPLVHRFLDVKYQQVRTALSHLENILNEREMADLLNKVEQVWKDTSMLKDHSTRNVKIESIVFDFLVAKGLIT